MSCTYLALARLSCTIYYLQYNICKHVKVCEKCQAVVVTVTGSVSYDHQYEIAYGELNGHVTYDIT